MSVEQIVARVKELGGALVELTGGEPLLQAETPLLAAKLQAAAYTVLVETSGERPIETLPEGVVRIMDLKCPDSGACESNRYENIAHLRSYDEVKFVLASRRDYEWAREMTLTHQLHQRVKAVLFSAAIGLLEPARVVQWILADKIQVRFQLQAHKFIWPPDARGV